MGANFCKCSLVALSFYTLIIGVAVCLLLLWNQHRCLALDKGALLKSCHLWHMNSISFEKTEMNYQVFELCKRIGQSYNGWDWLMSLVGCVCFQKKIWHLDWRASWGIFFMKIRILLLGYRILNVLLMEHELIYSRIRSLMYGLDIDRFIILFFSVFSCMGVEEKWSTGYFTLSEPFLS